MTALIVLNLFSENNVYPANVPLLFFFDDKILLSSVEDNFEVLVDGKKVYGAITINEGAQGYAIIPFSPFDEFKINKSIQVTVKKDMKDDGGNPMNYDLALAYTTTDYSNSSFDDNKGFENGNDGVNFIGDGSIMSGVAPLFAYEGSNFAAISSGKNLVSKYGQAIGDAYSMVTLAPINQDLSSVTFNYDFISAEFNEYVDSEFDDCAIIIISGPKGSYSEFITIVNTIGYNDVAFEGYPEMSDDGDSYAGHTGWTKRTVNFDKVGSPAFITFFVTDVSDHILSSILAIDDIKF